MAGIRRVIHQCGSRFDRYAAAFTARHPRIAFVILFIAVPMFILTVVVGCTSAVVLPLAWLMGWL